MSMSRLAAAAKRWQLTSREAEVLGLVAQGESNRAIGESLGCSERTVEVHITHLLDKAGVDSRTALVARFYLG
jgi:DNA-binding NarL/FixJ family response regulator